MRKISVHYTTITFAAWQYIYVAKKDLNYVESKGHPDFRNNNDDDEQQ